ncbi:hypothetical protein BDU57DRAFT_515617 [Ampelomyces quisqualis]|uniref:Uncharacterized protein n=1 Tax=Ampelomyces quisqualis TaxID=50730 RepID=A0A6A5QM53_AMPQU|nr:hypothetical protein BDU57DRAFT_515617 [Ampelomyces quisqualis]
MLEQPPRSRQTAIRVRLVVREPRIEHSKTFLQTSTHLLVPKPRYTQGPAQPRPVEHHHTPRRRTIIPSQAWLTTTTSRMFTLRAPSTLPSTTPSPSISPPTIPWLSGTWNVTHSTLPMWRKNRNVRITYTPIPSTSPPQLDDLVTYQAIGSDKLKTVVGIDRPFEVPNTTPSVTGGEESASMAYHWRGKGWLMVASSKWEILGYGEEESTGNKWVVTYFAATLFTPAGVDFYSKKGNLTPQTVEGIKAALTALGDVANLAGELFEITMDGDRKD